MSWKKFELSIEANKCDQYQLEALASQLLDLIEIKYPTGFTCLESAVKINTVPVAIQPSTYRGKNFINVSVKAQQREIEVKEKRAPRAKKPKKQRIGFAMDPVAWNAEEGTEITERIEK